MEFAVTPLVVAIGAVIAAVIDWGTPDSHRDAAVRPSPSKCQTITVQTGGGDGAGTNGRVYLAERHRVSWTELELPGDTFGSGAREEFPDRCGSFVTKPRRGPAFVTLGMSGNIYEQKDHWQVTSVTVGDETFTCDNRWLRPGQRFNCFAAGAHR